jgi:hypothetical protein
MESHKHSLEAKVSGYVFQNLHLQMSAVIHCSKIIATKDQAQIKPLYWYKKLLDVIPNDPLVNHEYGLVHFGIGNRQLATLALERAAANGSEISNEPLEKLREQAYQTQYLDRIKETFPDFKP